GLVVVDRDAEEANGSVSLQPLDGVEPVALSDPLVRPDVKLEDVDRVEAEVGETLLRAGHDPVRRERLVGGYAVLRRPFPVLRRHLRRDVDRLARLADGLPDEPLAVAVAVAEGRVEEVDAELDRTVERTQRLGVVGADPHRLPDAPGAVPELGDLQARPAERAVPHR